MDSMKQGSPSARALRYLQKMYQVDGWLLPETARCIVCISDAQRRKGTRGSIAEIGVHHGKLFILLCLLRSEGEVAVGYDLFGRQTENIDRSGEGDLATLKKNLQRMDINDSHLKLITANSLELNSAMVLRDSEAPIRLFSVDGGHTADITSNDLSIAANTIAEDGVVILDDFFNEAWPDVSTGASLFLRDNPEMLVPFAILGNKVFFAKTSTVADAFREILLKSTFVAGHLESKVSEFFGHRVFVGIDTRMVIRVGPRLGLLFRCVSLVRSPRVLAQKIKGRLRRLRARS